MSSWRQDSSSLIDVVKAAEGERTDGTGTHGDGVVNRNQTGRYDAHLLEVVADEGKVGKAGGDTAGGDEVVPVAATQSLAFHWVPGSQVAWPRKQSPCGQDGCDGDDGRNGEERISLAVSTSGEKNQGHDERPDSCTCLIQRLIESEYPALPDLLTRMRQHGFR